jgi:hypothetical protein
MTLLYYREENKRHALAKASKCSEADAKKAISDLCSEWGAKPIKVVFHKKKGKRGTSSWYRMERLTKTATGKVKHSPEHIDLSLDMLNYLTIAHEFAHYVHHHEFQRRRDLARAKKQNYRRERWHGPEHRVLVDKAVAYLQEQGAIRPPVEDFAVRLKKDGLPAVVKKLVEDLGLDADKLGPDSVVLKGTINAIREKFIETLPVTAMCPKCSTVRHRTDFGVRIMKKDARGLPLSLLRQSYCKTCRKEKP